MSISALAAAPRPLTNPEIRERLTSNTVIGTWNGRAYFQFFNKGGVAIY